MRDFTTGNITKSIVLFSIPMLIGNVFQQLYNMVDAMVVGRYVSGQALAAVGTAGSVTGFLISVLMGLTTGSSVVISQFFGARQEGHLKRTVSTSVIFLVVLALTISAVSIALMPTFMGLLDVPADVFEDTVLYLRISMCGVLFLMIYNIYSAYMRSLGDSRTPLMFLILASVVNIVLDIYMVAVLKWGVAGAATATVIAQVVSAVFCYLYAHKRMPLLRMERLIFDRPLFKVVLRYSIPAALQLSMTSVASLTIMRLVNGFGANAMAGFATANKIDNMALLPSSNISAAAATFVGQNMGAGLEDRARKGLRSTMIFMVGLAAATSVVLLIFGRNFMTIFMAPDDPNFGEIVRIGTDYLMVIAMFYFLHSVLFAFNGFFRGVGDAVIVMVLTITSLTIRAVFAYFFVGQFGMGPEAVAWSIPIGWTVTSCMGYVYYKRDMWKGKVAVQHIEKEEILPLEE